MVLDTDDLITPLQAADLLGTSKQQMGRWMIRGVIKTVQVAGMRLVHRVGLERPRHSRRGIVAPKFDRPKRIDITLRQTLEDSLGMSRSIKDIWDGAAKGA